MGRSCASQVLRSWKRRVLVPSRRPIAMRLMTCPRPLRPPDPVERGGGAAST